MLYVEYQWNKSGGKSSNRSKKRVIVGYHTLFVKRGSQSDLAFWKIKEFPEEYKPHQWFQIMVFDNLSNIAENSPLSNERLRKAQERCWQMRPGPAWKRRRNRS
jgi:hypothetical protein